MADEKEILISKDNLEDYHKELMASFPKDQIWYGETIPPNNIDAAYVLGVNYSAGKIYYRTSSGWKLISGGSSTETEKIESKITITRVGSKKVYTSFEETECNISFKWTCYVNNKSVKVNGDITILVDGAIKETFSAMTGTITKNIREYLNPGSNAVTIKIADGYNSTSTIDFEATLVNMVVSAAGYSENQFISLKDLLDKEKTGWNLNVTVTGGVEKELHMVIDGVEYNWNNLGAPHFQSGPDTLTIEIPIPKLPNAENWEGVHGTHLVELYAVAYNIPGKPRSNSIFYDMIWWNDVTPCNTVIIASNFLQTEGRQYEMFKIPYYIYKGPYAKTWVRFGKQFVEEVDGVKTESEIVYSNKIPQERNTSASYEWVVNSDRIGENIFIIEAGSYNPTTEEFTRETTKRFVINLAEQEVPDIDINRNLMLFELKASQTNNNDKINREIWKSHELSEKPIQAIFTDFDWETNGWELIDDRPALKISNGASLEIPYAIFEQPLDSMENFSEYGATISIDVSFSDVSDPERDFLVCYDEGTTEKPLNRGLKISPKRAMLTSGSHTIQTEYENSNSKNYSNSLRFDFVINKREQRFMADGKTPKDKLGSMFLYINGIGASASEYYDDNFSHSKTLKINSESCTVHLHSIRVFRKALEPTTILNNWMCDMTTEDKINANYRNGIYNEDGDIVYSSVLERIPCMRIIGPERPTYKGDKKENIDIIFEGTKDGLYDFKIQGVQLDVQGTSSQYYPVKNWKFKSSYKNSNKEKVTCYFETAKGKSDKYALGDDQLPATVFCLKADYMETSSTHNTVTANFANGMYDSNKKTPPQSPRKNKQGIETEAEKERASKTRTTIYGRPIIVFYQKDLESELVFGGKYNFNYDKDAADVFGFLSEDEEYESYEVIDCVEFRENMNDRCLLKVSDYEVSTPNLSPADQDDYDDRSLVEEADGTVTGYEWGRAFEFRNYYHKDDTGKPYEYLKPATDWILETDYNSATNNDLAEPYIVAKGIANFNYDADLNIVMFQDFDGRNRKSLDLGYLEPEQFDYTIETHFQIQHYEILNEGMENEEAKKTTLEKFEEKNIYIEKYGKTEWNNLLNTPTTKTQKPEIYYALAWNEDKKSEVYQFRKDSQNYRLTKFKNELPEHFNEHYCLMYFLLMEMLGMIDSSTKNMFWATWGERHDNHKQKDENGKYKDKVVIWYPIFYDMDTMMGINNVGEMTIPYNVEFDGYEEIWDPEKEEWVKSYYYNGHENVFWNNFRKSYVNELNETFRNKVTSGVFSLNNILKTYEEHSNNFPEAIYNEDGLLKIINKYFEGFYEANPKEMEDWTEDDYNNKIKYPDWMHVYQGDRYYYRRFWLPNRFNYLLSKNFAGTYAGDLISMRLWDPGIEYDDERKLDYGFDIVTWTDQYTRIKYGGRSVTQRCEAYVPTRIEAPGDSYNDTEMAIYGASNLKSIGNLSTKYASNLELSAAKKLLELDIGNSHPQYNNANLRSVSFGSNSMLRRVNVENCRRLDGALALESCPNINEINARGTSITGVQLPQRGVLKTLLLPDTVTSLVLTNQTKLETFELPSKTRTDAEGKIKEYYGLTKLVVDNVPQNVVNTKVLLEKSINTLESLYLTGINWSGDKELDNYDLLFQIKAKYENGELVGDKVGDSSTLLRGTVTVKEGQDYLTDILLRFFNNVKEGEELPPPGDDRRFNIICRDEKTTHTIIFRDEQGNQIESGIQDNRVLQGQGRPSFSRTPPIKQSEWYNEYQFFCWYTEDNEGNQTLYSDRDIYYKDGTKKEGIKLFQNTPVYSDMIFYPKYFEKPKEFKYKFIQNNGTIEDPIILAKFDGDEYFNAEGKIITHDYDQVGTSPTIPDNENSDELVAVRYKYWVRENHSEDTIDEGTDFTLPDIDPGETELIYRPGASTQDTKHRFTFLGWNGKVLTEETILYEGDSIHNIIPTIKDEDAWFQSTEKNYTFKGWTLTDVQENTPETDMAIIPEFVPQGWQGNNKTFVYKAVYASVPRPYLVTFKNWDGSILQQGEVNYGSKPPYEAETPTKAADETYTYSFSQWSPEITEVKGEQTYEAQFNKTYIEYKIEWKDQYGTTLRESEYKHYGDTVSYTPNPSKESSISTDYTFNGWKPAIAKVTGDQVYVAQYKESVRQYTIKFIDWDKKPLNGEGEKYNYNTKASSITRPSNPSRTGWTFTGWGTIVDVTGDATYQAQYSINTYTITFKGWTDFEGKVVKTIPVSAEYGKKVNIPSGIQRTGYKFLKWKGDIPSTMPASNDLVFEAEYQILTFDITFNKNNGESSVTKTYNYGATLEPPQNLTKEGHKFTEWSPALESYVTGKYITYTAQYETLKYKLKFVGCKTFKEKEEWDDIEEYDVLYNTSTPNYPIEELTREGYDIVGWSIEKPEVMPANEVIIKAIYQIQTFVVTFKFDNGEDDYVREYNYNSTLIRPDNPKKDGYTHTGWAPEITDVVQNKETYVAQYTPKRCLATFKNKDDPKWNYDPEGFYYDSVPFYSGKIPTKESSDTQNFSFVGWVLESEENNPNATIYINEDEANEKAVAFPAINNDFVENIVENGVTFVARFEASTRYYVINFYYIQTGLENTATEYSKVISIKDTFEWNDPIIPPTEEEMIKQVGAPIGYTFNGWSTNKTTASANIYTDDNTNKEQMSKQLGIIDENTKNNAYYAIWTINKYTITFNYIIKGSNEEMYSNFSYNNGYRKSTPVNYYYGSTPQAPINSQGSYQSKDKDINFQYWRYTKDGTTNTGFKTVEESLTYEAFYTTPDRIYRAYWYAGDQLLHYEDFAYGTNADTVKNKRPKEYRVCYTSGSSTVNGEQCAIHKLKAETAIEGNVAFKAEMWYLKSFDVYWGMSGVKSYTEASGTMVADDANRTIQFQLESGLTSNKDSKYRILDLSGYNPNPSNTNYAVSDFYLQELVTKFKCKIDYIAGGLPTRQLRFGIINGNGDMASTGRDDYTLTKEYVEKEFGFWATSTNSSIIGFSTLGRAVWEGRKFFLGAHTVANGKANVDIKEITFTAKYHYNKACEAQATLLPS